MMDITLILDKPCFIVKHYEGYITKDASMDENEYIEERFYFEVKNAEGDLTVIWTDIYDYSDKSDIEDKIIEQYLKEAYG